MFKLVKKQPIKPITLREHYERKDSILIKRRVGGYGDILMQRMMFEDFSKNLPQLKFTYCCPEAYLPFASNHPFVKTQPWEKTDERNYGAIYDISTACRVHESRHGIKNTEHRSDIWAKHCGVDLNNHKMHLATDEKIDNFCRQHLAEYNPHNFKTILLALKSTSCEFGIAKSMTDDQIKDLINELKKRDFFVFTVHNEFLEVYEKNNVPQFVHVDQEMWKSFVNVSDFVISVDTATFHLAGGLNKKLVGIFSFTNGKIYGKYYNFTLVQRHFDNGNWDCGPCYNMTDCPKSCELVKPCMTSLQTSEIIEALDIETKKEKHES
jgi:ADP-heptose:LPS heptosyltransferase